jgi:hypothetical protein
MKNRYFLLIAILLISAGCGGKSAIKPSIVGINPDGDANAVKIQAEKINGIEANMSGLQKGFDSVSAKLNAQAGAIAGINNKLTSTSAGRDAINTTTNDSELMKYIVENQGKQMKGLMGLISALLLYAYKERRTRAKSDDKLMTTLLQVAVRSKDQSEFDQFMSKRNDILKERNFARKLRNGVSDIFKKRESEKNENA